MMQHHAATICLASLAFVTTLMPLAASAGTWNVFGPQVFLRGAGAPKAETRTFSVIDPNAVYILQIRRNSDAKPPQGGVEVTLNGARLQLGPVSASLPVVGWAVPLRATNQLTIELRGAPGESISVTIAGVDNAAPTIQATINPQPNAAGWNTGPVTVTFACADGLSGIAFCTPPATVSTPGSHTVAGVAVDRAGNETTLNTTVKIATSFFTLRNYGGKCLDVGPLPQVGAGVYLKTCNGSAGQQIRVEEMNANHQVRLYAGSFVIGFDYDPEAVIDDGSAGGGSGIPEGPLKLQAPANPMLPGLTHQLFSLDGDSIIAAVDRNLVAQVENARGADGTPIVWRKRKLADAEFWDFLAIDGSDVDPTSGFVRVDTLCALLRHIPLRFPGQPPDECTPVSPPASAVGMVIKISPGAVFELAGLYPLQLSSGVTIRGGRRGLALGAQLCMATGCDDSNPFNVPATSMMEITGSDARITGLRIEGPSRSTGGGQLTTYAILARDSPGLEYARTIIDNNDISGWSVAAVQVAGPGDNSAQCDILPPQTSSVFVKRNFLHHNRQQEKGYGVVTSTGAFPVIEGNTFLANRHAIAASGGGHTGYAARFNLVLSESPLQDGFGPFNWYTHDFDQHGNGDNGFGGTGGLYQDIFRNTFLGTNRTNYKLRSDPCYKTDFRENVSLVSEEQSVVYHPNQFLHPEFYGEASVVNIQSVPSQFEKANPTNTLASGDFDGDGHPDMFLATGAAWYYSPGSAREWRYLSENPAPLSFLRFGDFDGDGRTDVVGVSGGKILVSWGGVSSFEVLNDSPSTFITDMAVGQFVSDFSGDRRDDLFFAGGGAWYVSSGGSATFLEVNTSSKVIAEMRFGDFDGNGFTDVFAIESNVWKVSYDATSMWTALNASLTDSVEYLFVADFDADGHADVGKMTEIHSSGLGNVTSWTFAISHGGGMDWASHAITPTSSCAFTLAPTHFTQAGLIAGIANVDGIPGADLVAWGAKDGNNFCVISSGIGAAARLSSQDMR